MGGTPMKVKMAVFGHKEIIERVQNETEDKSHIDIIPFSYSQAQETVELIDKAFMCDVYVFTDVLSYTIAQEEIEKKRLPTVRIPIDEYAILAAFYKLRKRKGQPLKRVSIDIANEAYIKKIFNDLSISDQAAVYTYSYEKEKRISIEKVVNFHKGLWNEGKISDVLTSSKDVAKELKHANIPTHLINVPQGHICQAIEQAEKMIRLHKGTAKQIVAGHIQVINELTGEVAQKHVIQNVHDMLLKFGRQTNTSILLHSHEHFTLFGTRDLLQYITSNFRTLPLLEKMKEILPPQMVVNIGFGFGLTIKEAEKNAHLAIEKCRENRQNNCYIVNEREEVIGPIGIKREFDTSKLYEDLIHKARLNNQLSYNFIQFITKRNNEPFSSHDIALHYKVTKRSAERTINKLLSGNIIKHVGEERPYLKGRPRKLFQLKQQNSN